MYNDKAQCWIDDKIIWIRDEEHESMTVFFYDENGVVIETSTFYPNKKKILVTNRGPQWDWNSHLQDVGDETLKDWVSGTLFKNAERDAMRIPHVFFTNLGDQYLEHLEKAIVEQEARTENDKL